MKRVAVISDATSPDYFFPVWYRYYAALFGAKNLFIITYLGLARAFEGLGLGAVVELPIHYHDERRAQAVSGFVGTLLSVYDVVVRCDIDEFIVPDKTIYADLAAFIARCEHPYVTAQGVDVFESDDDAALDYKMPILVSQRRKAIRAGSLNKTCITSIPLRWAPGFHSCSAAPVFSDIFLFHLKFSDVASRVSWFDYMSQATTKDSAEARYFDDGLNKLQSHKSYLNRKQVSAFSAVDFAAANQLFLSTVRFNAISNIYQGDFGIDDAAFLIPDNYRDIC